MTTLEEVSHSLTDLVVFLDITSLKSLSTSSYLFHYLVNPHISSNMYFSFYSQPHSTTIQKYFRAYKPKMLHLMLPFAWDKKTSYYFKDLPSHLTHLKLGNICDYFPENLKFLSLPVNLRYFSVNLDSETNGPGVQSKPLGILKSLPNSIPQVCFLNYTNPKYMFPPNLTHLDMSKSTTDVEGDIEELPRTLTYIAFYDTFDQSADNLPPGLTHLYFGSGFNSPVDNLPRFLVVLKFGFKFEQSIDLLPPSVRHLSINNIYYTKPITKLPNITSLLYRGAVPLQYLPQSLRKIDSREGTITNLVLPPNLKHFQLDFPIDKLLSPGTNFDTFFFPESIITLSIVKYGGRTDCFPKYLISLMCTTCHLANMDNLPLSLVKLKKGFSQILNHSIDHLPKGLTHLQLNIESVDYLPLSLTHLTLTSHFTKPLDHLPPNLTHLKILTLRFNQHLDYLPHSLIHLIVYSREFNCPLDNLPTSLKYLSLNESKRFNQFLDHLPPSIIHLSLPREYNKPQDNLPSYLTFLHLPWCRWPLDHLPESLFHLFCDVGVENLYNLPRCCTIHRASHWINYQKD